MSVYDEWTYEDAQKALSAARLSAGQESNILFYEGDHWQDGKAWLGSQLEAGRPEDVPAAQILAREIHRQLVSKNIVAEIVQRHYSGVLGRQFTRLLTWKGSGELAATDQAGDGTDGQEDAELIAELDKLLDDWLEREDVDRAIEDAATALLLVDRAPLRFLIPPGRLDEDGTLEVGSAAEALDNIFLMSPAPGACTVYTDPATQDKAGIFGYTEDGRQIIEMSYTNDAGETTIRILGDTDDAYPAQDIDLDGQPTIYELRRAQYITEQIRQQQKLYNLAATMMGRNTEIAGFRAMIIANADMPGQFVDDGRGGQRFLPDAIPAGAGQMLTLRGVITEDAEGMERIATPTVEHTDPVPVTTFIDTEQAAYSAALEEGHQLHYLIAGDATASGVSREAAQADHIVSIAQTKKAVDRALTWALKTAIAYVEALTEQAGRYTDQIEIKASCRLYPGPVSQSMMVTVAGLYRDGLLSAETALEMIGVENIREEIERISVERPDALQQLGEVEQTLADILAENEAADLATA